MKSFSEYIKEAYNFRLGGSQKKGFNQKLFDLDYFIKAVPDNDVLRLLNDAEWKDDSEDKKYVLDELKFRTLKEWDEWSLGEHAFHNEDYSSLELKNLNFYCTRFYYEKNQDIRSIAIVDNNDKCVYIEYDIVQHFEDKSVDESYSFRLGGSQKKGFNQTKYKSFAELKKGDVIYEFDSEEESAYEHIFRELTDDDIAITIKTTSAFGSNHLFTIYKDSLDDSFSINENICLATSEEQLLDVVKREFDVEIKDEDIARL